MVFASIEWLGLVFWLGCSGLAYFLCGGSWRNSNVTNWYEKKNAYPLLQPSTLVISIFWGFGLLMIAVATFLVWRINLEYTPSANSETVGDGRFEVDQEMYISALAIHLFGLFLVICWVRAFFGIKRIDVGIPVILLLLAASAAEVVLYFIVSNLSFVDAWWVAGVLYSIYTAWILYIAIVNITIFFMNRKKKTKTTENLVQN